MFTLGIFKQSVRNKSKAWRNLGFVKSNVKEQYSQKDIKEATQNKHTVPKITLAMSLTIMMISTLRFIVFSMTCYEFNYLK